MEPREQRIKKKRTVFSIEDKIRILARVDAHMGTRTALAAQLGLKLSTLNTIVNMRTEIEKSYSRYGPSSSKMRRSLKSSPLEELESILLAWFKQARIADSSLDGTHLKEKALHIATCLGIGDFRASNGWIDGFKRRHNLVYKAISAGENTTENLGLTIEWKSEPTVDWKSELPKLIDGYKRKDIFSADETGLLYLLQPSEATTLADDCYSSGRESRVTVLLGCNANGTEKLPPLVIGKQDRPEYFRNIKKLCTEYTSNSTSWMTPVIFQEFLVGLDSQMKAENRRILLFIDQCTAHLKVVTSLKNIIVIFFPLSSTNCLQPLDSGITQAFKFQYRKQLVRKTVAMIDGGLIKNESEMKISLLTALHFITEAWKRVEPSTIANCFKKCGFLSDVECVNDRLSEQEKSDWCSLKPPGVEFDDYVSCDAHISVCEVQNTDQTADECLVAKDEVKQEKVDDQQIEVKVSFVDALQGLESARQYTQQFYVDNDTLAMFSELENRLYSLRYQEKLEQMPTPNWSKQ